MQSLSLVICVLLCLQVKHFIADFLLQPAWMVQGKGDVRQIGGYVHAGAHAIGSVPALLLAGLLPASVLLVSAAEFAAHYVIDFSKADLARRYPSAPTTQRFWAMHGADQLAHQLTYAMMMLAALMW